MVPLLTPGRVAPNLLLDAALALPLRGCDEPHLVLSFAARAAGIVWPLIRWLIGEWEQLVSIIGGF